MPAPPAEDDDLEEVLDLEPRASSRDRRSRRRDRRAGSSRASALRRWQGGEEGGGDWDEVVNDGRGRPKRERTPVYWRARDSLYFEPLVALAIIVLLLVSLFAYTSNWPPVYVVESNSMQHGSGDRLGVINAGDIVLAQRASLGSIVTYVDALRTGYSTYGSLGDVILYYPNGSAGATPIVHRAIVYLQYDSRNGTYNATGLAGLPCGASAPHVYYTAGPSGACATTYLTAADTLNLYGIGGRTVAIQFSCTSGLGGHSGFLTLGDNNTEPDQIAPACGIPPLSTLAEPGWVVGVARGLIPWFGALKLLLDGNAARVPTASWEFMGLTISGVIFAAAGVHVLLRRRRETRAGGRSRYADEDEDAEELEREDRDGHRRTAQRAGGGGMRPWQAERDAGVEPQDDPGPSARRAAHEERRRSHFVSSRERRPARPHGKGNRRSGDDDGPGQASARRGRSRL